MLIRARDQRARGDKLAARGITGAEIEQVVANGPHARDNPLPRVAGSTIVIGPTDGARFLTLFSASRREQRDALARHDRLGLVVTPDRRLPSIPIESEQWSW